MRANSGRLLQNEVTSENPEDKRLVIWVVVATSMVPGNSGFRWVSEMKTIHTEQMPGAFINSEREGGLTDLKRD